MNINKRMAMVRAMDFLVRSANNEELYYNWAVLGVADGDVTYDNDGPVAVPTDEDDLAIYYEDDDDFAELMDWFLEIMGNVRRDGGLYVDGVVSREKK